MATPPSDPSIEIRWIHDTREVQADVTGAPELYTPAGKTPIEPRSVTINYNTAKATVTSVVVYGTTWEGTGRNARWPRGISRRVEPARAPGWLCELIDEHRP